MSAAASSGDGGHGLQVHKMYTAKLPVDLTDEALQGQLISKMCLHGDCKVEEMQGFQGGLNQGIWFARIGEEEFVLKLVRCSSTVPGIPTDAESYHEIIHKFHSVAEDPALAFPVAIFGVHMCTTTSHGLFIGTGLEAAEKVHDLIVMRKMPGERLAELIGRLWYAKQVPSLLNVLEHVGRCLAEFHVRYDGTQHGDFQPSNIFVEESTDRVSLIDLGGMSVPGVETDVEHFLEALRLLSGFYGEKLLIDGRQSFEQGYEKGAHTPRAEFSANQGGA